MKTKFHLSAGVSSTEMNCLVRHQSAEQSLFDIPKSRATLLYYEIEMVRRTTFICSSTCRKAAKPNMSNSLNLYNQQRADSNYIVASTVLNNFYITANDTPHHFRKMADIEDKLFHHDLFCALNLINTFIPSNGIEQNHKSFYLLYYSWYNNPSAWSEEDDASLINLAMKCPHFEGAVIYHARSFYNLIHPDQYNFIGDACDPVGAYKSAPVVNNQTGFTKFDVILYPNPTTSKLNLICNHCDNSTELIIHDAIGHQVWNQQLKYKNGEKTLEFNLPSGIYTITITNKTTKENETKKLIVE